MPEQAIELPEGERGVTIMLPKDIPLPAFVRIVDERNAIIQQYQPTALDESERALTMDLVKAVRLALVWLNSLHHNSEPLRHAAADTRGRLLAVIARAEALGRHE